MSQGDIERKTGLLRCCVSRVENGHAVPAVETLEKMARATDIRLYQLFFEPNRHNQPRTLDLRERPTTKLSHKDTNVMSRRGRLVARLDDRDKKLLVGFAQKLTAS